MMKRKSLFSAAIAATMLISTSASAGWFGNNNDWDYDDNDWPEWTPMYWMEEMMDEWDNDDDEDWYRYGGYGYGPRYGYGGGYGAMPYPQMPPAPMMPYHPMQMQPYMAPQSNYMPPEAPRAPAPAAPNR
jgi:hypothetical protein